MTSTAKDKISHLKLVTGVVGRKDSRGADSKDFERAVLMAHAQDGDQGAYRRLLQDITPYIRSIAGRRLSEPSDIEDAVQDVLLTVHSIRHTYDPTRPFAPWLATIANRRVVDILRRVMRSRSRHTPLEPMHETFASPETNIEEGVSNADVLAKAIDKLPQSQREAVTLLKLKEMSLNDAAVSSGMSVASLKVAMHRALKNLRKIIGDEGGEA